MITSLLQSPELPRNSSHRPRVQIPHPGLTPNSFINTLLGTSKAPASCPLPLHIGGGPAERRSQPRPSRSYSVHSWMMNRQEKLPPLQLRKLRSLLSQSLELNAVSEPTTPVEPGAAPASEPEVVVALAGEKSLPSRVPKTEVTAIPASKEPGHSPVPAPAYTVVVPASHCA
ncbi:hypothetical protein BJV78DRAFT_912794 [Lactifluus subvellereus]|nr:hypothetical protein BJV78DRAFT_912794 [Lactifluus subvellereus]